MADSIDPEECLGRLSPRRLTFHNMGNGWSFFPAGSQKNKCGMISRTSAIRVLPPATIYDRQKLTRARCSLVPTSANSEEVNLLVSSLALMS